MEKDSNRDIIPSIGEVTIDGSLMGKGYDFTMAGMYVFLKDHPFRTGSPVRLSIPFRKETIELDATVDRIDEGFGIALKFPDLDTETKLIFRDFFAYFSTRVPDVRSDERILFHGEVRINDTYEARIYDLSTGGMYVLLTGHHLKSGDTVNIAVSLNGKTVRCPAVIVHVHEDLGISLKFSALDEEQKSIIREHLARVVSDHP